MHGHEPLDRLLNEILTHSLSGRRHSKLLGTQSPLAASFIKALLPELEHQYELERMSAQKHTDGDPPSSQDPPAGEAPVTEEELTQLQKEYDTIKTKVLDDLASEHTQRLVVVLHMEDTQLAEKLDSQPLFKDGSVRLWNWHAGLQATKDPSPKTSPIRIKATANEEHLKLSVGTIAGRLGERDTALFMPGRNAFVWAAIKKSWERCDRGSLCATCP